VAGEREVAVLFVDIRGYTAFAEDRAAAEIFSAVNRYTRAVSEIVKRHHGSVVEFNGDGMMAVFGAPEALPGKEREALETALEVVAAMPALDLRTRLGEALAVGVGIATGQAFVGNVQSAERATERHGRPSKRKRDRPGSRTVSLDAKPECPWHHAMRRARFEPAAVRPVRPSPSSPTVVGSGTATLSAENEKSVLPEFPVKSQSAGVSSKPVACRTPVPVRAI
jgi:hypothetical protein